MSQDAIIWTRFVETPEGEEEVEVKLPTKFEVCGRCQGKGTHVNPSIDGNGISEEEWNGPDWSEDEQEAYMSGQYDVTCYECHGQNVVKVVDWDHLNNIDPELAKAYGDYLDDEAEYHRVCEMERRMGA